MTVTLRTERIRTLADVRAFLDGNQTADYAAVDRKSAYAFVERTLARFGYHHKLRKGEKGFVKRFLEKATGLSRAQITRLIAQHRKTGRIRDRRRKPPARPFPRRYTSHDLALLAQVDEAYDQLSGPATKEILRRMHERFGDERFERLARISNGHLYNLRKRRAYRCGRMSFRKTRAKPAGPGVRRKPRPEGKPGFLRVDTVHQGDQDGEKGVYHINIVDEVTQFQFAGSVSRITEYFLVPVLEDLLGHFPFVIHGFHSDNGSEYVNGRVANLLNKLHINEFTKSRPRRSNDNGLVETKNGCIIRKWLGHSFIPKELASATNEFLRDALCPLLNYHRPCLFATQEQAPSGRVKRRYRQEDVATPYEKLKSLPDAEDFLKPGVTFAQLDQAAHAITDLEAAEAVQKARDKLRRAIGQHVPAA